MLKSTHSFRRGSTKNLDLCEEDARILEKIFNNASLNDSLCIEDSTNERSSRRVQKKKLLTPSLESTNQKKKKSAKQESTLRIPSLRQRSNSGNVVISVQLEMGSRDSCNDLDSVDDSISKICSDRDDTTTTIERDDSKDNNDFQQATSQPTGEISAKERKLLPYNISFKRKEIEKFSRIYESCEQDKIDDFCDLKTNEAVCEGPSMISSKSIDRLLSEAAQFAEAVGEIPPSNINEIPRKIVDMSSDDDDDDDDDDGDELLDNGDTKIKKSHPTFEAKRFHHENVARSMQKILRDSDPSKDDMIQRGFNSETSTIANFESLQFSSSSNIKNNNVLQRPPPLTHDIVVRLGFDVHSSQVSSVVPECVSRMNNVKVAEKKAESSHHKTEISTFSGKKDAIKTQNSLQTNFSTRHKIINLALSSPRINERYLLDGVSVVHQSQSEVSSSFGCSSLSEKQDKCSTRVDEKSSIQVMTGCKTTVLENVAYMGIHANPPEIVKSGMSRGNNAQLHRKAWLEVSDKYHRYGKNLRLYYKHWVQLNHPTNMFFDWLDSKGEAAGRPLPNLEACPRSQLDSDTVLYITNPDITSRYRMNIGRHQISSNDNSSDLSQSQSYFYDVNGVPVDTGPNGWIFVLRDEIMYAAPKITSITGKSKQRFHHSSFFGGKAVACAGIIITDSRGRLCHLYPHSGHYRPGEAHMYRVLLFLSENGFGLSTFKVDTQQIMHVGRTEFFQLQTTKVIPKEKVKAVPISDAKGCSLSCNKNVKEKQKKVNNLHLKPGSDVAMFLVHKASMIGLGVFSQICNRRFK